MTLSTKVDICNLALSNLGNKDTVTDIDTPNTDKEKVFALWYDVTRRALLRETIPSFATDRAIVAQLSTTPDFGYSYEYEYPSYALKILGIGNVEDKENSYSVENNKILYDIDEDDGLQIRFIRDEDDVTKFTPEFKILLGWQLAQNTCLAITQDASKLAEIKPIIRELKASMCAINTQENRPIRISTSRFRLARSVGEPETQTKK